MAASTEQTTASALLSMSLPSTLRRLRSYSRDFISSGRSDISPAGNNRVLQPKASRSLHSFAACDSSGVIIIACRSGKSSLSVAIR